MSSASSEHNRRLATILALDVVGYSRAAERDDETAAMAVRQLRSAIVDVIAPFGGRIFNSAGDGFMLEFRSAASGVQAAMALLAEATGGARQLPTLRIGMHLGDVIVESSGDLLGHGVNVAARLQALADPGTAMVSETVRSQVRASADLPFAPQGRVQLDKMEERLEVFSLDPGGKRGLGEIGRRRLFRVAALAAGLVLVTAVAWWALRPHAAPHAMMVRLAKFELLSEDLPANLQDTVAAEITAAFNVDGVVGVSSAPAAAPGASPAYALTGSIQRNGGTIRVITHLVNERSGATLWSATFNYEASNISRVPRHIAVDAGNVIRCGLFGASTYDRPLPDAVFRDYLQFCQGHWDPHVEEGGRSLVPAQRVVAALPDFSWGWAAVAGGYWKVAANAENETLAEEARASGRQAADRAIALDPRNSEALYIKAMLLAPRDWIGRDALFRRAVAARRLDCGCEYHQYGWMLLNVGRTGEALEQLHRANDMLALYVYTPESLAEALVVAGRPEEAHTYFDAAIDLAPDTAFSQWLTMRMATRTPDITLLANPALPLPDDRRAALLKGYHALASRRSEDRAQAVRALLALEQQNQDDAVAVLLAALGASHEAFQIAARIATTTSYPGPSFLWDRNMREVLAEPGFPALAESLGLLEYWRTTGSRPDVCSDNAPPPFCRMI